MKMTNSNAMDLPIQAHVYTGDRPCGETVCVVLNPVSERVTDVVVKLSAEHGSEREVLVPLYNIAAATENEIKLDLDCEQVRSLPEFRHTDFYEVEVPVGFSGGPFVMWPYVVPELQRVPVETDMVPANELAIHRGAQVISASGPVGKVDEFLIDPESELVTHIVMREGHLWGRREVLIPVSAITRMEDDEIKVSLNKEEIEALPEIPIHRNYHWERAAK
jgi:sporulation protein YlmC with PRC-barrel domain